VSSGSRIFLTYDVGFYNMTSEYSHVILEGWAMEERRMQEARLSRKEKERFWRHQHIISAARELFAKKGYHNISMHEIARKAEFAIGTVYKFFRNKEDLYKALVTQLAADYHRVLMEALKKDGDTLEVIRSYIAAKAKFFSENRESLRLYFAESRGASFNLAAGLDKDVRELYMELLESLEGVMELGARRGVLRDIDPHYMAISLEGLTDAFLLSWSDRPEGRSLEEEVPIMTELFLRGCSAGGP